MKKGVYILLSVIIILLIGLFVYIKSIDKKIPTIYYLRDFTLIENEEMKMGINFELVSSNPKEEYLDYQENVSFKCYDKENKFLAKIVASCINNEDKSVCENEEHGFMVNSHSKANGYYSETSFPDNFFEEYGYCELIGVY